VLRSKKIYKRCSFAAAATHQQVFSPPNLLLLYRCSPACNTVVMICSTTSQARNPCISISIILLPVIAIAPTPSVPKKTMQHTVAEVTNHMGTHGGCVCHFLIPMKNNAMLPQHHCKCCKAKLCTIIMTAVLAHHARHEHTGYGYDRHHGATAAQR
jgi:hypothetical protein